MIRALLALIGNLFFALGMLGMVIFGFLALLVVGGLFFADRLLKLFF
jgi:hypothetical protein